ncbi:MAG: hypothetical protein WAN66_27205 [Limnoraphis robusta]|jgi:hypothetical protein|uniref:Uncharacterized protein n=1 Tax=Limnoraphis robusta CS-951 TaxID=1637645 RepID=A0A0F5YMM9_9CYAN|nr:hypothetical protein [Limnoraphis robusta]KKD39445.1 hypothetical protein WN50_03370 [Limnoraphis robusta CS-951]MCG5061934.1 hypothetical protein [Limnoraphis sp. WC205]
MSSFKEFMDEAKKLPNKALPTSNLSISAIQGSLQSAVSVQLAPFLFPQDKAEKFSEQVSNLVQDKAFISKFSDSIGEPLENETEDEFVERSSNILRKMLYKKFGIKD